MPPTLLGGMSLTFSVEDIIAKEHGRNILALTDNERGKKEKRDKRRSINAGSNYRWSDQQKLEAVQSYLAIGNLALTSRILGIPEITLRVWKTQEWWHALIEDLRLQENIQLSARMKKLVEASQNIVAQRLESGDPIMNQKTGEIVYKPVSMKDAHKVSVDLIDRQKDLQKMIDGVPVENEATDGKLEALAEKFAEMSMRSIQNKLDKQRTVDVTDVTENKSAVHDERQARLPEGTPMGEETSGASNTSSRE